MRIYLNHKEPIKHQQAMLMVNLENSMQWVKLKNLKGMYRIKVVLDNQDHLLSKVSNAFPDSLEKYSNLMTHKNLLMYRDHGCTQKIHLLQLLKLAKLIKPWNKIMNYHSHSELEKEQASPSAINQRTIDTREVRLQLSRIRLSLENEKH